MDHFIRTVPNLSIIIKMEINGGYDDRTRIDPESGHRLARLVLLPMDATNLGEGSLRMEE